MSTGTFRKSPLFRAIAFTVLTAFIGLLPAQPSYAQVAIIMPPPGEMIHVTSFFEPSQMVGLTINPKDPFSFDFIMDQGQSPMSDDIKKEEFNKIIKYFLVSLTMPNKDMWVNLSPFESKRIIPEIFAQTDMGRDLLAQDYILKQFTASLMYPEDGLGKKFWDKVYQEAQARFGTTEINVNTFNKVWIVADHADVYQKGNTAFLVGSHLKVMLEQDYMAIEKNKEMFGGVPTAVNTDETMDAKTQMASQLVREIIIPAIEKEVNEGQSFAAVRQVYNAEIMATWFKRVLRQSLLGQVFANKSKIDGQRVSDPQAMEKIYHEYLRAYKKGVFNYIREDATPDGQTIPRKYFSGGMESFDPNKMEMITPKALSQSPELKQEVTDSAQRVTEEAAKNNIFRVTTSLLATTGLGLAVLATPASAADSSTTNAAPVVAHEVTVPVQQAEATNQIARALNLVGGVTLTQKGYHTIVNDKGNPVISLAGGVEMGTGGVLVAGVGVPATVVVGTVEYGASGGGWVAKQTWNGTKWAASETGNAVHTIAVKGGNVVIDGAVYEGNRLGNAGESVLLNAPISILDIVPGFQALTGLKTDHEKVQALQVRVQTLTADLSVAEQNVTNITATANQNAQAADQYARSFRDAQQRVTDLKQQIQTAQDDFTKASTNYQNNLAVVQGSLTTALDKLVSTQKSDNDTIDGLRGQVNTLRKTGEGNTATILDLEHQIVVLNGTVQDRQTKIKSLGDIQTKLDDVSSQLTAANGTVQDRDTEIGKLNAANDNNVKLNANRLWWEIGIGAFLFTLGAAGTWAAKKFYDKESKAKVLEDQAASNREIDTLQAKIKARDTKVQRELDTLKETNDELQRQKDELQAQVQAAAEREAAANANKTVAETPAETPLPPAPPALPVLSPAEALQAEFDNIRQQIADTNRRIDDAHEAGAEPYAMQSLEDELLALKQQQTRLEGQMRSTPAPAPTVNMVEKVNTEIASTMGQIQGIANIENAWKDDSAKPVNAGLQEQDFVLGKARVALSTGKEYGQVTDDEARPEAQKVYEERTAAGSAFTTHQQAWDDYVQQEVAALNTKVDSLNNYKNHLQDVNELNKSVAQVEQAKNNEVSSLEPENERAAEFYKIRTWKNNGENISWEQQQKDAVEEIQELSKSTDQNLPTKVQQAFDSAKNAENGGDAQAFEKLDRELAKMIVSEVEHKYSADQTVIQLKERVIQARVAQTRMEERPEIREVVDRAAVAPKPVGGINLSDENLTINIKVDGAGMPLPMQFQDRTMMNLNGLTSVIRKITPLVPEDVPGMYALVQ